MQGAASLSPLLIVVTSAGVAAVISGLATLAGQYLERRARRNELILQKALDMAAVRTDLMVKVANTAGVTATLYDNVIVAEKYFRWLAYLIAHGELPPDAARFRPPDKPEKQE